MVFSFFFGPLDTFRDHPQDISPPRAGMGTGQRAGELGAHTRVNRSRRSIQRSSLRRGEARAQTRISKVGDRRDAWARGRGRRVQAVDLANGEVRSHGHQRGAIPAFLDKALSAVLSASKAHRRKLLGPNFFLGQALCTLEGGPGARVSQNCSREGVARARKLRKSARSLPKLACRVRLLQGRSSAVRPGCS